MPTRELESAPSETPAESYIQSFKKNFSNYCSKKPTKSAKQQTKKIDSRITILYKNIKWLNQEQQEEVLHNAYKEIIKHSNDVAGDVSPTDGRSYQLTKLIMAVAEKCKLTQQLLSFIIKDETTTVSPIKALIEAATNSQHLNLDNPEGTALLKSLITAAVNAKYLFEAITRPDHNLLKLIDKNPQERNNLAKIIFSTAQKHKYPTDVFLNPTMLQQCLMIFTDFRPEDKYELTPEEYQRLQKLNTAHPDEYLERINFILNHITPIYQALEIERKEQLVENFRAGCHTLLGHLHAAYITDTKYNYSIRWQEFEKIHPGLIITLNKLLTISQQLNCEATLFEVEYRFNFFRLACRIGSIDLIKLSWSNIAEDKRSDLLTKTSFTLDDLCNNPNIESLKLILRYAEENNCAKKLLTSLSTPSEQHTTIPNKVTHPIAYQEYLQENTTALYKLFCQACQQNKIKMMEIIWDIAITHGIADTIIPNRTCVDILPTGYVQTWAYPCHPYFACLIFAITISRKDNKPSNDSFEATTPVVEWLITKAEERGYLQEMLQENCFSAIHTCWVHSNFSVAHLLISKLTSSNKRQLLKSAASMYFSEFVQLHEKRLTELLHKINAPYIVTNVRSRNRRIIHQMLLSAKDFRSDDPAEPYLITWIKANKYELLRLIIDDMPKLKQTILDLVKELEPDKNGNTITGDFCSQNQFSSPGYGFAVNSFWFKNIYDVNLNPDKSSYLSPLLTQGLGDWSALQKQRFRESFATGAWIFKRSHNKKSTWPAFKWVISTLSEAESNKLNTQEFKDFISELIHQHCLNTTTRFKDLYIAILTDYLGFIRKQDLYHDIPQVTCLRVVANFLADSLKAEKTPIPTTKTIKSIRKYNNPWMLLPLIFKLYDRDTVSNESNTVYWIHYLIQSDRIGLLKKFLSILLDQVLTSYQPESELHQGYNKSHQRAAEILAYAFVVIPTFDAFEDIHQFALNALNNICEDSFAIETTIEFKFTARPDLFFHIYTQASFLYLINQLQKEELRPLKTQTQIVKKILTHLAENQFDHEYEKDDITIMIQWALRFETDPKLGVVEKIEIDKMWQLIKKVVPGCPPCDSITDIRRHAFCFVLEHEKQTNNRTHVGYRLFLTLAKTLNQDACSKETAASSAVTDTLKRKQPSSDTYTIEYNTLSEWLNAEGDFPEGCNKSEAIAALERLQSPTSHAAKRPRTAGIWFVNSSEFPTKASGSAHTP